MQALEGMDPLDQQRIESYERRTLEGKGVPLGPAMWGGDVAPDQEAGLGGKTLALGAALVVGGVSDTLGAIPAGLAGITALSAEAITGRTPEGKDFYGEENVSGAGEVVEQVSNLWNDYITKNAMELVMPESLEDDTEEMHHKVQAVTVMALDGVARAAQILAWPTMQTLRNNGVETHNYEATIDAHARGTATLAMLVLGMKTLPGMKGGGRAAPVSVAEMDAVLGSAAHQAAAPYIHPETLAARNRPGAMPSWESYQAGKAQQPRLPDAPPSQPELPGMAAGEAAPLQRTPPGPKTPQMDLPFEAGLPPRPARSPANRPMAEYHLEGELMPARAPFKYMEEAQVRSIIEGVYEDLTPNSPRYRLEQYQEPASAGGPPVKGGGEVPRGDVIYAQGPAEGMAGVGIPDVPAAPGRGVQGGAEVPPGKTPKPFPKPKNAKERVANAKAAAAKYDEAAIARNAELNKKGRGLKPGWAKAAARIRNADVPRSALSPREKKMLAAQRKQAKAAYQTQKALVDEMNAKVAEIEMAGGQLQPMDLAQIMPGIAAQMLKELHADAAALRKVGVTEDAIVDVLGGLSAQRMAAKTANNIAFTSGMMKLFTNPKVRAMLEGLPQEMQQHVQSLMQKSQKVPELGERFKALSEVELGKTMETQNLVIPPSKGVSQHIAKFTVNELISLYRELLTAKPGIFVPGRGTMTTLQRGFESLTQQAVAKWGSKGIKAQEGVVSARGEFYTPAEMSLMKQLIDTAKHDFPDLSHRTKVLSDEFADAMVKFRMDVSPEARALSAKTRRYTLEEHGITMAEQPGYRGKPGEQGYFNADAFNLLDPLRAKWAARAQQRKNKSRKRAGPKSAYKNKAGDEGTNYTGAKVTKKDMTKRAFIREYVFGGKMIGALQRTSVDMMDTHGKYGLARVTAMLDQFPKFMWREKMGTIQTFYQLHTKAFADLIADSGNGVSLAATLAPFQAKFVTGARRYMRYLPGGLTLQRLKPSLVKEAFLDLTSPTKEATPLGAALRSYADYLYRYGADNGVEMATYVKNWYPVIFRKLGKKDREAFVALHEAKARSPQQLARARVEVEHVFDLAFENGGLIPADMKPGLNGKHLNAEMRRQFFDKYTMEELRPFIVNDPGRAMYSYAKGLARRVANNARWGNKEQVWKGALQDAVKEGQEVGMPLSKEDLATLEAGRQILAHTYQTAPSWYIGMMRLGIAWQNAAKLGLVMVGSLAEIGVGLLNPTMQKHYAKALVTVGIRGTVQNIARAIWRDVPQHRARRLAEAVGRSVDVEMHDVLTATHAADIQSVGSNIVFQLNGLHALTNMLQDINVAAFEGAMKEAVVKEFNHRLGKRKKTEADMADADVMKMYGIDMEAALGWYRDGGKIGGAFWDQQYAPALLKYLNDTVITPRGVNMPRWMSNPWLAPIRHLLTYTSVFANTVLPDMLYNLKGGVHANAPYSLQLRGQRGAQAAGGVAAIYGLGTLAENLLDEIKYGGSEHHPLRDKIKDDEVWMVNQIARHMNRTGVYGLGLSKLFDAYESYHYGRTDYRFIDGAFLTEAAAGAEVLGLGLLAGEIDAKQAAKWLVRNGIPIHAATVPRDKKAPLAEFMPTRQDMEDDLAKWLDHHVPGVDRKSRTKWKPK